MERFPSPFAARHAALRRKRAISIGIPLLGSFEVLEPRTLLAATAVLDQGMLRIQGDAQDNTIDVAIAGDTVTVTCDGTALTPFTGYGADFSAIKLDAAAGNDTVTVSAQDLTVQAETPVRLAVEGGTGDDVIRVQATNVAVTASDTEPGTLQLSVGGGLGNDTIDLAIQGLTVDETACLTLRVTGGDGEDLVTLLAEDATIAGRAALQANLGKGNDQLDLALRGLTVTETGTLGQQIHGGLGDDVLVQQNSEVSITGWVNAQVSGDAGDDTFALTNDTVTVDGTVNAHIRGGLGDDTLTLNGTALTINGTVRAQVQGGLGDDTLNNQMASDAVTRGPEAVVDVRAHDSRWASLLDDWHNPRDAKTPPETGLAEDSVTPAPERETLTSMLRRRLAGLGHRKAPET